MSEARKHDFGPRTTSISIGDVLPRLRGDRSLDDSGNINTIFEEGWQRMWQRLASLGVSYDAALKHREAHWADTVDSLKVCESPIERALLAALMVADYPGTHVVPMVVHNPKTETVFPNSECVLIPQFAFAKYRMDFGLICRVDGRQLMVDIECDGAEYHKRKVADASRDEYLKSWGIPVFRFKGSEIYEYPLACANKVISHVIEWRGQ